MDHDNFQKQVQNLYAIVKELEAMFPGRPFTPDGHMVGSLGECLAAHAYGLVLMPPSNEGYDALTKDKKKVEIKSTQGDSVAFRSCPEHTIIICILRNGTFEECYNGPGNLIWQNFENKKRPSNGQYQISISKVKALNEKVPIGQRISRMDNKAL